MIQDKRYNPITALLLVILIVGGLLLIDKGYGRNPDCEPEYSNMGDGC